MKNVRPDLKDMARKWESSVVARPKVGVFSGGSLTPGHMANLDSAGVGVPERIRIGRKVVYPVDALIRWMEERSEVI